MIFLIYSAIFLNVNTTIKATQTAETVSIADSRKSKSFENNFNLSFADKLSKASNRAFSATISLKSINTLLIIVAVIQIEALLNKTKIIAAMLEAINKGQYVRISLNNRICED